MKKHNFKALALGLPLVGSVLASPATFAVNNYNIEYTGGNELSGKVNAEGSAVGDVQKLTPLIPNRNENFSFSDGWGTGYYQSGSGDNKKCQPTHYLVVRSDTEFSGSYSFGVSSKTGYSYDVTIDDVSVSQDSPKDIAIGVIDGTNAIHAGEPIFNNDTCSKDVNGGTNNGYWVGEQQILLGNDRVFIEMTVKLYKENGKKRQIANDGLFFGITDIDAAQSYQIINENSKFDANTMISPDATLLRDGYIQEQTEGGVITVHSLENKFVASSNDKKSYIYSEYNTNNPAGDSQTETPEKRWIQSDKNNKLYAPVDKDDLRDGLNFVFGFGKGAGSNIQFFAKQYNIKYTSDDNGKISEDGIEEENILIDESPSGTETEPAEGYEFSYWVADKDIKDKNGNKIEAGTPISDEELTTVTLNEDTIFTAIHEKAVAVPDTGGIISKELSGAVVPMSIAGIVTLSIVLFYLPRINHKKVNFKKK